MSTIKYIDTDGNKSALLPKGTFGYDDFQLGGDKGRVYVGTGEENLPLAKKSELEEHENDTTNPHAVTQDQVGLGNVDNTADIDKPVSTATQAALDLKADQATTYTKDEVNALAAAQNEASELGYDNTVSGLTATTVQDAIDEVEARVDTLDAKPVNKFDATIAPTVTDDSGAGYSVGSVWIDVTNNESYRCIDDTVGAAVWIETTLTTDEISALSTSYDNTISGLTATNVKGALDELDGRLYNSEQVIDRTTAATGTGVLTRYDKILGSLNVVAMDYTSGNLDYVRYEGDDDATVYYRDVMTYNVDGDLVEVKHYWNTADLVTASGQTVLTYVAGDLATATYSE
jgi:hypothetical protein